MHIYLKPTGNLSATFWENIWFELGDSLSGLTNFTIIQLNRNDPTPQAVMQIPDDKPFLFGKY